MTKTIDLRKLYIPTEKQTLAHIRPERFVLFGGAVGGGKSVWLCNEGIQLSLECAGNVGFLCRHELASLMRTTLITMERYLPSEIIMQHHQTENFYRLINGSLIFYGGLGDDQKAIERLKSMELGWFAVDQAEETSESHFFMLASRLRLNVLGVRYKGLLSANPAPGWVKHRFVEQKLSDHVFVPALPKDNPNLPPDYESKLRELYPPELVKQLLEGDWDTIEAGKFLFRYGNIRNAAERKFYLEGDRENRFEDEPHKMGVDIAAGGENENVATIRRGNVVEWIEAWSDPSTMSTTGRIIQVMERFKVLPGDVNIDAIGIGKGVYDRLIEQGHNINGIISGGQARDKEHFANIRAEGYFSLAKRFEDGLISIPDDEELKSQLCSIRYDTQSDKRMIIVSKDVMKSKYNVKSPDRADSLMLAFYESDVYEGLPLWFVDI